MNAAERTLVLASPVALGVLELFHPLYRDDALEELLPVADRWLAVHLLQAPLIALLAAALYLLAHDAAGIAGRVVRIGSASFGVLYVSLDAVAGIATGVLARHASTLPEERREAVAAAIEELFTHPLVGGGASALTLLASAAWLVAVAAVAVVAWRDGAHRVAVVLLGLAAVLFPLGHTPPNAQLALGCFAAGVALVLFGPRVAPRAASS